MRQFSASAAVFYNFNQMSFRAPPCSLQTMIFPTHRGGLWSLPAVIYVNADYSNQILSLLTAMKVRPEENGHKSEKKKTKPIRDAGFLDIMRGCDCLDVFLLFFGIIFSVASGAVQPLGSVIFKGITDTLIASEANYTNGNLDLDEFKHQVLHYCLLYFVMGVSLFTVAYISNACLYTLCERRAAYIRKAYLRAVMRQNVAWFDENDAGALTMRMSRGVEKIKEGAGDKLVIILSSFGCFVSGIAIGFTLCWQLSLVMMITVPLLLGTMYVSGKMLSGAAKREMAASSSAGSIAMEVLSGIRTVMAFNAQPQEVSRYGKQLESARDLGIRKAYVLAAFAAVPLCLMFAMMSIAFWYGTTLVINGTVTPGTIFAVFWAVLLGTMRLGQAAPQLGVVLGARLAARDIFSVIDRVPQIDSDRKDGIVPDKITGDIQVQDVHFSYPLRPEVKVLDGINLEVSAGQTVALVGPSGCGKSTILGFLQRFYEQDAGIITLDGIPLRDYNIRFLRSIVGVVQQEPVIFMATVAENIRMGDTSITDAQLEEICKQANAHEFVTKLIDGYNTVIGEGAIQLSGGQKQRIALARVLARQPKILLLDEATSALDSESEHVVTQALEKASQGRTTITVAHRLSTIRNSDKIYVFSHGQIVESGTHDELLEIEDGVYAKMIKAQEIAKGEEDTTLDDVDPIDLIRGVAAISADGTEEPARLSQMDMKRASDRVRQSLVSNNAQEEQWLIESARYEMEQEGAMEASLTDIFRYSRPEMTVAILGLVLTILRGLTWPIFSVIYGKLFKLLSELQAGGDASESISNSFMFLALSIYCGITTFSSGSLFGIAGEKMASRLRLDVYKNLLRQDASYFDEQKHNVGTLTSRLSTDAPNVQAAIDQRLSEVLQGISSLIAGVSIAFYFGWNMAPIGLAAALMLVAAQSAVAQYLKFRGAKDMEVAVEATRLTTETILNVKCIQSLNRQDYMYASYCNAAAKPFKRAVVRGMWQSFNLSLGMSFVNFNFAIAYAFGMMLVLHGWSTPFTIFQVIEALNMATFSVMAAASYFPEYVRARISAGVMFSMMKHQPRFDNMSHQGETPNLTGSISLKSVYFSYPTRPRCLILDGIAINAKFGQTVALVGSSGSGKSTVIQLLERFYDPLCGSVSADSYNIRDLSIQHWRSQIALVGQEPTLFDVTIRENIAYGMEDKLTQEQIEQAAKLANIHSFVASLPEGYETKVGPRGGRLSGGQKQRISIARAIVRNPKILLLDEATSALDADSQKVVQEALDRARLGRTCIVVAHRLSTIQNADLIVVCRDGRVFEQGTHVTLMARKGFYYRLVKKQQH